VLAFEYGFGCSNPYALTVWDARYSESPNDGMGMVDEVIAAGHRRWGNHNGLVLLVPLGTFPGEEEDSVPRIDRYLRLCGHEGVQLCLPSTPAQLFHLLIRQMIRPYRRPLLVVMPDVLLSDPFVIDELVRFRTPGRFENLLVRDQVRPADGVRRVILCCGDVIRELAASALGDGDDTVAACIEQLYPFPAPDLRGFLARFPSLRDLVWFQREPLDQGLWPRLKSDMSAALTAIDSSAGIVPARWD
jgi:2-oxoglutarate dehydrogenase E1 component